MTQTSEILCAHCHVALKGPESPKPDDRISCPNCGEGDRFDTVMEEVKQYIADRAESKIADSFENAFKGIKNVSFKKGTRRAKRYRFIVDLKL